MNRPRKWGRFPISIRWQVILPFLLLSLLAVALLSPAAFLAVGNVLKKEADSRLNEQATTSLRLLQSYQQNAELYAAFVGSTPEVQAALAAEDRAALGAIIPDLKGESHLQSLVIYTPALTPLYTDPLSTPGDSLVAQQIPLAQTVIDTGRGQRAIIASAQGVQLVGVAPVSLPNRQRGAVLVGYALNETLLAEITALIPVELGLVRGEEIVTTTMQPNNALRDFVQQTRLDHSETIRVGDGTNRVLLRSLPTAEGAPPWELLVMKPVSELFALQGNLQRLLLIYTLGIGVASLIVGTMTARTIATPIEQMTNAAELISQGDFSHRVPLQRGFFVNELTDLTRNFNGMAARLEMLYRDLEKRITARTRDLEIAADLSKRISMELELSELLPQVAELTRTGFRLAHVSIYLYDPDRKILELAATTGDAKVKSYHLGQRGLIPKVARERTPIMANDLQEAQEYLITDLQQETRAQVGVPMFRRGRLIGVLDLQANQRGAFTDDDLRILTSLGEQIAVAIQNARLYEEQVATADELRSMDRMKSQFLASMSHELRTPLNAILNYTQFVSSGMMGDVNEKQVETLEKVVKSGEHLLALINDILDISKIEAGKLELFLEEVDISEEAVTAVDTMTSLLNNKPVEVDVQLDMELPVIAGDRRRIRQIFLNLASNAAKFTQAGRISLRTYRQGNELVFCVADTGPGISVEDHTKIFESFVQSRTGITQGGGTGLGLPISRRLAEAHGGRLWLESEVGRGSTFYVALPATTLKEIARNINTKPLRELDF